MGYKDMYYKLFRETTKAIETLQTAQQECERMYLNEKDAEMVALPNAPPKAGKEHGAKDRNVRLTDLSNIKRYDKLMLGADRNGKKDSGKRPRYKGGSTAFERP